MVSVKVKLVAFSGAVAVASGACVFDGHAADRPARFQAAINSRQLASSSSEVGAHVAPRTTQPTGPTETLPAASAVTGSAQFTMAARFHTYLGAEAEAGTLGLTGSSFAGAYGIAGWRSTSHLGSLAVEVAAGRRTLRYAVDSNNLSSTVFEPRLRGEFWLTPQITFGATVGASPDDRGYMAGMYLSVYSHDHDAWPRR